MDVIESRADGPAEHVHGSADAIAAGIDRRRAHGGLDVDGVAAGPAVQGGGAGRGILDYEGVAAGAEVDVEHREVRWKRHAVRPHAKAGELVARQGAGLRA